MKLLEFLNQHLINFIPKNVARDIIWGWHPITLLSIAYKIMANALAFRVRKVAKEIVRLEKIGFVYGRFILDTVLPAWEVMGWAKETSR